MLSRGHKVKFVSSTLREAKGGLAVEKPPGSKTSGSHG
jgi:hypothetical protein